MKKTKLVSELMVNLGKGLKANGHAKNEKIEIAWDGCTVCISGVVKNYYQRQVILSIVQRVCGAAIEIRDSLIVDK